MLLFCETRNGVAAKEVQRQLGVTYKTAWRMCHLIRLYMGYVDGDAPIGGHGKTVEADETFIGGVAYETNPDNKATGLGLVEPRRELMKPLGRAPPQHHIIPR